MGSSFMNVGFSGAEGGTQNSFQHKGPVAAWSIMKVVLDD